MKKIRVTGVFFALLTIALTALIPISTITATTAESERQVIYIDEDGCPSCARVHEHGVITGLEAQNVDVIVYDIRIQRGDDFVMAGKYADVYGFGLQAPVVIAGDEVFIGPDAIIDAYDNGDIYHHAQFPLRSIDEVDLDTLPFFEGLWLVAVGGLLSGFNPCAIAMLLMFISMIGFVRESKVIIIVSIAYIAAVFVTHFAIVYGFLALLGLSRQAFTNLSLYLYGFFGLLTLFLAILTFSDFLMARRHQYENVKNQLPAFIRKFNEKIMTRFTKVLDSDTGRGARALWLIVIPVVIGVIVGITEAACTAQPMLIAFARLEANMPPGVDAIKFFYLLVSNVMFIVPLIVIAIVAIKSKNTMSLANFIRANMSKIKLATAVFFLAMAIYFTRSVLIDLDILTGIPPLFIG